MSQDIYKTLLSQLFFLYGISEKLYFFQDRRNECFFFCHKQRTARFANCPYVKKSEVLKSILPTLILSVDKAEKEGFEASRRVTDLHP